jgi:hypothetical protein
MSISGRQIVLILCFALLAPLAAALPALAHGDTIIPQFVDGTAGDGTKFKTKLDIINLSQVERITKVKVLFFRQDGSSLSVATNQGTGSEITLSLGRLQTIRIETLGTSTTLTSGYAIVRNTEITSIFSEDFEVAVSVFYEIGRGSDVIDTVSVPLGQPTVWFMVPVEIDVSKNLLSGLAIVNLDTVSNRVDLRLWQATTPTSNDPTDGGTVSMTLNSKEQRARYLTDNSLYPSKTTFRGALVGIAERPVAVLALLQTPAQNAGLQYATLAATAKDALRTSTYTYLRQGFALDADIPQVDYFGNSDESLFWDILYETQTTTTRRLTPRSGATLATLGQKTDAAFDAVTLEELQGLSYSSSAISLNDGSSNLAAGFSFAIRTGLGRYVKVKLGDVITRGTDSTKRDLALEIYVYR